MRCQLSIYWTVGRALVPMVVLQFGELVPLISLLWKCEVSSWFRYCFWTNAKFQNNFTTWFYCCINVFHSKPFVFLFIVVCRFLGLTTTFDLVFALQTHDKGILSFRLRWKVVSVTRVISFTIELMCQTFFFFAKSYMAHSLMWHLIFLFMVCIIFILYSPFFLLLLVAAVSAKWSQDTPMYFSWRLD